MIAPRLHEFEKYVSGANTGVRCVNCGYTLLGRGAAERAELEALPCTPAKKTPPV